MYKFLEIQYRLGKITAEQLQKLIGIKLTAEQYKDIVGE
jgi:hypothetical protein